MVRGPAVHAAIVGLLGAAAALNAQPTERGPDDPITPLIVPGDLASYTSSASGSSTLRIPDVLLEHGDQSLLVAVWIVSGSVHAADSVRWGSHDLELIDDIGPFQSARLRWYKLDCPGAGIADVTFEFAGAHTRHMGVATVVSGHDPGAMLGASATSATTGVQNSGTEVALRTTRGASMVLVAHASSGHGSASQAVSPGTEIARVGVGDRLLSIQKHHVGAYGSWNTYTSSWAGEGIGAAFAVEIVAPEWVSLVEEAFTSTDAAPPPPPNPASVGLRLGCHNIEYSLGGQVTCPTPCCSTTGGGGRHPLQAHIDTQADAVREAWEQLARLDIVAVQEFYDLAYMDLLNEYLSERYPYRAATAGNFDNKGALRYHASFDPPVSAYQGTEPPCYGNTVRPPWRFEPGLFSRYPINSAREIEVLFNDPTDPIYPRRVQGAVLHCEVQLAPRETLDVYVVHIGWRAEAQNSRPFVTATIIEDLRTRGKDPAEDWIVVCGDFNANPYRTANPLWVKTFANLTENGFRNTWDDVPEGPDRWTRYACGNPTGTTIDHIYVSKGLEAALGPINAALIPDSGDPTGCDIPGRDPGIASDHWGLYVELFPVAGTCYPDCDGNGRLDFFDWLCFQNAFLANAPYADCDDNGVLDFFDFLCFQDEFLAGCP